MKKCQFSPPRFAIFIITFTVFAFLIFSRLPQLSRAFIHHRVPSSYQSPVHFSDVTKKYGLYAPSYQMKPQVYYTSPIVIVDINNDGRSDIFLTGELGNKNLLFINKGNSFQESSRSYGLDFINPGLATAAVAYDYNQDGLQDLVIAYNDKLSFFRQQPGGKFQEEPSLAITLNQFITSIAIADLQNDNEADLVLSSYFDFSKTNSHVPKGPKATALFITNFRYNNIDGGSNIIVYREKGKMRPVYIETPPQKTFSLAVGINDVNNDGLPDVFFSNDYSYDQLFINKGPYFEEQTNQFLPLIDHGLSGMNAEFYDYDKDGLIDLFVTNIYQENFFHGGNVLWKKNRDQTFSDVSFSQGLTDCGFSWGAKFGDFDNDGEDDLIVTNGLFHTKGENSKAGSKSLWYLKYEMSQVPVPIKKHFLLDFNKNYDLSSFQPKCIFSQKNGQFYDISKSSGIDNLEDRKSLALIDFNNDGKLDVLMRGTSGLELYENDSIISEANKWIGFSFSHPNFFGTRVSFKLSNGKQIVRELYPTNGLNVLNEARLHIGLGPHFITGPIKVTFPGKSKNSRLLPASSVLYNSYNPIALTKKEGIRK